MQYSSYNTRLIKQRATTLKESVQKEPLRHGTLVRCAFCNEKVTDFSSDRTIFDSFLFKQGTVSTFLNF